MEGTTPTRTRRDSRRHHLCRHMRMRWIINAMHEYHTDEYVGNF